MTEKTIEETVREIGASFTGKFFIEGRSSEGIVEQRDTVFDTALVALELYKITKDTTSLQRCFPYFEETVIETEEGYCRWRYNAPRSVPGLPPFPPDADTTALPLVVFALAEQAGLSIPAKMIPTKNKEQFRELLHPEGIRTWFGDFMLSEVPDPVVTSAVALFYARAGLRDDIGYHLQQTLNKQIMNIANMPEATTYYPYGRAYFAARAAEINAYDQTFLERNAEASLDKFLEQATIRNTLEAAWIGTAAAERGVRKTAEQAKEYLLRTRLNNGLWSWEPVHNQKTYWQQGHEVLTTLFAVGALQTIDKKR
ncbi:hypothetical protein HZC31_03375 [Candidatus Woesearchaeota archaeon]|nr:hypothetical protein [Candidatus Woesearchaeota archaeon]